MEEVDGRVRSACPVARTVTVAVYWPGGAPAGTNASTHSARASPAGTSKGKAFRFSPTTSSTSGTSASGKEPVTPSGPLGLASVMIASRKSRGAGSSAGPVKAVAVAETPDSGPATAIWKASNSFRAAASSAPTRGTADAEGRTFSVELTTQAVVACTVKGLAIRSAARARARDAETCGQARLVRHRRGVEGTLSSFRARVDGPPSSWQ